MLGLLITTIGFEEMAFLFPVSWARYSIVQYYCSAVLGVVVLFMQVTGLFTLIFSLDGIYYIKQGTKKYQCQHIYQWIYMQKKKDYCSTVVSDVKDKHNEILDINVSTVGVMSVVIPGMFGKYDHILVIQNFMNLW